MIDGGGDGVEQNLHENPRCPVLPLFEDLASCPRSEGDIPEEMHMRKLAFEFKVSGAEFSMAGFWPPRDLVVPKLDVMEPSRDVTPHGNHLYVVGIDPQVSDSFVRVVETGHFVTGTGRGEEWR
jgi:hypothetical protein